MMASPHMRLAAQITTLYLLILVGQLKARPRRSRPILYTDCGTADKVIHFTHLHAEPIPIVIPGTLYVSMAGNVTSDLPRRMNVYMTIRKYFFGFPFVVPCLSSGVGSCSYENICNTLEQYERHGCPDALRHQGYSCHCPFQAGEFTVKDIAVNIPKIEGFASTLLTGDYEMELAVQEEDGPQLGCLRVGFSVKKRGRGWLFKI